MLRWALDLVLDRGDVSWSLENVSTPKTREVLAEYRDRFPDRVDFATLDSADFGAAQTRIRLIAAPPQLIRLLQEMPSARRVSVRDAFEAHGLEVPATHFKNQTRNRDGTPCQRAVEQQAFTVCASHALTWSNREGQTHKVMTARQSAVLMGFGTNWRLPKGSRNAQRAVGNALCVSMSKAIVQAAVSLRTGLPVPTTEQAPPTSDPSTLTPTRRVRSPDDDASDAPGSYNQRLKTIESLVRSLHDDPRRESLSHRQAE